MLFDQTTFLGIDPTAGKRPMVYAALGKELELLALGAGGVEEVLAFAAGQQRAFAGICSPSKPNGGWMRRQEVRQGLTPPPSPGRWLDFRVADYLLRRRRINTLKVPGSEPKCPRWMREGFALYQRLEAIGYREYPADDHQRQWLEIYPHACFAAMLGVNPLPKHTLEGRLQRQLALYEHEVGVEDPMRIFEEITRFRLLRGILPLQTLHSPAELDALVAAYTVWKAATAPAQVILIGHPEEGRVALPCPELKERY
jgi:hypothetical protein